MDIKNKLFRGKGIYAVLLVFILFPIIYFIIQRKPNAEINKTTLETPSVSPELTKLENTKKNTFANPSFDSYFELGLQYHLANQNYESILATEKALEFNPKSALAYNNLGVAYNALQMWDKGIEACQNAIQLQPDFQLAKNNLSWALMKKKKIESK